MAASADAGAVHNALQAGNCGAFHFDGTKAELSLHRADGSKSRFSLVYATPSDYPSTPLLIVPDDPSLSTVAEVCACVHALRYTASKRTKQEVNEPLYDGAPLAHAVVALAAALHCDAAVDALQALADAAPSGSYHESAYEDMEDVDEGVDDDVFVSVEEDDKMLVQVMQQYGRWQQKETMLAAQEAAATSASVYHPVFGCRHSIILLQTMARGTATNTSLAKSPSLTHKHPLASSPTYAIWVCFSLVPSI